MLTQGDKAPGAIDVVPLPVSVEQFAGSCPVSAGLEWRDQGPGGDRVREASARLLAGWERRLGCAWTFRPGRPPSPVLVAWEKAGAAIPLLGEDESYRLEISAAGTVLRAATDLGALRGLATLEQLLVVDGAGAWLPVVKIADRPRFPWRGLMVDVCRHWLPPAVIRRTLDGMALAKFNVLHLHLADDQGFRFESRTHPRLHERGSDGHYFTQAQLREIVAAAAARSFRVVPEMDVPGHATAWLAAYPELASQPGAYAVERRWGVHDAVLDPTNEKVYGLLADLFAELADVFPDPFVHIGGDENNGKHWGENADIQKFMVTSGLADHPALQAWLNRRVQRLLVGHGKQMVGWDEVLHPDLPRDTVIQSWRGADSLAEAARRGFRGMLSSGYYLDHCHPAAWHYGKDPLPADDVLTEEERARVLGGEAAVWTEWISEEMFDGRTWPRAAAVAERLWSPRAVTDTADLERRLAVLSERLAEHGLQHEQNEGRMIRRLAQGDPARAAILGIFASALAPIANYRRSRLQVGHTQATQLTGLEDAVRPDGAGPQRFAREVEEWLRDGQADAAQALAGQLRLWRGAAAQLITTEHGTLAVALADACDVGLEALSYPDGAAAVAADWAAEAMDRLAGAAAVRAPMDIAILVPLHRLVAATQIGRGPEEGFAGWRRRVEDAANLTDLVQRNLPPRG
ncbi:MAG: family 20 glycosylhydrolase [Lacunisphaera sp.]|nr:family 20 glycosylhydrolase [Lacunisphaera sp.]